MSRWNLCFDIYDALTQISEPMLAYGDYEEIDLSFVVMYVLDDLLYPVVEGGLQLNNSKTAYDMLLEFDIPAKLGEQVIEAVKTLLQGILKEKVPEEYSKRLQHRQLCVGEFVLEVWIHDSVRENTPRLVTVTETRTYATNSIADYSS